MQGKSEIEEYIAWLIDSHDDIKNVSQAVEKIAEITFSKPRSVYYWKNGRVPLDEGKAKLMVIYREQRK